MKITDQDKGNGDLPPRWDLSGLFPLEGPLSFTGKLAEAEREARAFVKKYRGSVPQLDGIQLGAAVEAFEKVSALAGQLSAFVSLTVASGKEEQFPGQAAQECLEQVTKQLEFFTAELALIGEVDFQLLMTDPKLSRYSQWLQQARSGTGRGADHELEKYIHDKSEVAEKAWRHLSRMLSDGLRCRMQGRELTKGEILNLLRTSEDADTRLQAYAALAEALGQDKKASALVVNTLAALRSADHARHGAVGSHDCPDLPKEAMQEAALRTARSYYAWKAKKFGTAALHPADRQAPLPGQKPLSVSWTEAKDSVLSAFGKFSPEMAEAAGKFFDQGRINAEQRPGRGGPELFCPSDIPYIFLGYNGGFGDVTVLARALGYGVHQGLASGQGYLQSTPSPLLAEAGGAFAEMLVFTDMLEREADPAVRRCMIAGQIENMLDIAVQWAVFSGFEKKVYQEHKAQGELPPEKIEELWRGTVLESLGNTVDPDAAGAGDMWSADLPFCKEDLSTKMFGACLAYALYDEYTKSPDKVGFAGKYIGLLKSGGEKRCDEALAAFGLDVSAPQFWEQGMSVIGMQVEALIALDKQIESTQEMEKDFKDAAGEITVILPPQKPKGNKLSPRGPGL